MSDNASIHFCEVPLGTDGLYPPKTSSSDSRFKPIDGFILRISLNLSIALAFLLFTSGICVEVLTSELVLSFFKANDSLQENCIPFFAPFKSTSSSR